MRRTKYALWNNLSITVLIRIIRTNWIRYVIHSECSSNWFDSLWNWLIKTCLELQLGSYGAFFLQILANIFTPKFWHFPFNIKLQRNNWNSSMRIILKQFWLILISFENRKIKPFPESYVFILVLKLVRLHKRLALT